MILLSVCKCIRSAGNISHPYENTHTYIQRVDVTIVFFISQVNWGMNVLRTLIVYWPRQAPSATQCHLCVRVLLVPWPLTWSQAARIVSTALLGQPGSKPVAFPPITLHLTRHYPDDPRVKASHRYSQVDMRSILSLVTEGKVTKLFDFVKHLY